MNTSGDKKAIVHHFAINALPLYPLFREEIERLMPTEKDKTAPLLFRLTRQLDKDFPLLETVAACQAPEKFYFSAKDKLFILAGLESALTVETSNPQSLLAGVADIWKNDATVPLFGGFSFDKNDQPSPEWQSFNTCRFTLPFVEFQKTPDGCQAALNFINSRKLTKAQILREISGKLRHLDEQGEAQSTVFGDAGPSVLLLPDKTHWNAMVKNALGAIAQDAIQKIVLARKIILSQSTSWNPAKVLIAMSKIKENSFTFFYQINAQTAFLGRSPERLLSVRDGKILAEAIAGTRPRGKNDFDDQRLEAELLDSRKERAEHRFVSDFMESGIRQYCRDVRVETSEEIIKLKNVQHIFSRFTGVLNEKAHPLELARYFHPTPAVGGYPRENILKYIRQSEPFCRGWYAAPIGWFNKTNADFAVGIRSALISGNQVHIFAGAGIVRKSTAQAEWKEIEKKMNNFKDILKEY